jgi:hypothetical protein
LAALELNASGCVRRAGGSDGRTVAPSVVIAGMLGSLPPTVNRPAAAQAHDGCSARGPRERLTTSARELHPRARRALVGGPVSSLAHSAAPPHPPSARLADADPDDRGGCTPRPPSAHSRTQPHTWPPSAWSAATRRVVGARYTRAHRARSQRAVVATARGAGLPRQPGACLGGVAPWWRIRCAPAGHVAGCAPAAKQ